MALLSSAPSRPHVRHRVRHGHMAPVLLSVAIAAAAGTAISYLLWPTWTSGGVNEPSWLPISVGKTLFNVPTKSVRVDIQRHSGPQERIDLSFSYPSLEAGSLQKTASSENIDNAPAIDLIFLSIAAHSDDRLAPEERLRTIYPRYFDAAKPGVYDGLERSAFRDNTPYANEDLFTATSPHLVARCTRDTETPGMCLSESRLEGADLTFRFPRSWLTKWRDVASAMDGIVAQIYKPQR